MSNIVFIGGRKGGAGKTATAHLLCLGAILCGQPASYILTDPDRKLRAEGRPYGVIDGKDPTALAQYLKNAESMRNGWLIVDGGGNRPAFDKVLAAQAQLTLLPFRDSDEDTSPLLLDLEAMPDALAWPSAWPTNPKARQEAQKYIDRVKATHPLRVIMPPLDFVHSANQLLGDSLENPSTPIRSVAKRAFRHLVDLFDARNVIIEAAE